MTKAEQQRAWRLANPERVRAAQARYREKHAEKIKQARRAYYAANRVEVNARSRKWQEQNREQVRASGRKSNRKRAGVLEPSDELRSGICPICLLDGPLVYDHCHVTGVMRGWLCRKCNRSLGGLGDSLDVLRRAVTYLECPIG